jgi:gluconolactonase
VMAYDVSKGGALSNGRKFAEPEWPKNVNVSGADGMTVDSEGNLYVATTKSVQMFNKKGTRLATISCPSPTNNVTFGGVANKTLFNVSSR